MIYRQIAGLMMIDFNASAEFTNRRIYFNTKTCVS